MFTLAFPFNINFSNSPVTQRHPPPRLVTKRRLPSLYFSAEHNLIVRCLPSGGGSSKELMLSLAPLAAAM